MVAFTLTAAAAGLVALASTASAAGGPPFFKISTCATTKNPTFNGLYISSAHIAAGDSALVATPSKTAGIEVQFNGTVIYEYITSSGIEYFLHLDTSRPVQDTKTGTKTTAPKGYYLVDIGVDGKSKGFSTPPKATGTPPISYNGPVDFETFALCTVSGIEDIPGKATQLLYRSTESKPDTTGQCEDVVLHALFESLETGKFPNAAAC